MDKMTSAEERVRRALNDGLLSYGVHLGALTRDVLAALEPLKCKHCGGYETFVERNDG